MKVRDVLRLLNDNGWVQVAQKGSHRQFRHPDKPKSLFQGNSPILCLKAPFEAFCVRPV